MARMRGEQGEGGKGPARGRRSAVPGVTFSPLRPYHASPMQRLLLLALGIALGIAAHAQNAVRINDPSAIVLQPDLERDPAAQAGMKAAGLSASVMQAATRLSTASAWPAGLRTDSARMKNKAAVANYAAYVVCSYATDEGALSILSVPAANNHHMPEDLRSPSDFYLVLRPAGFTILDDNLTKEPPSKGPSWRNLKAARILKPDGVYATFDLGDVPEALDALDKQGLSKAEVEAVVFRSHERNWPDGIDSFEKRYPKLNQLKKYKAFRLARWDDKVLLVIPSELNKKAAAGLRPYLDIYMVFDSGAVQVKEKKR